MSTTTEIEWTDSTWNVTTGCTKVSQGCKHCYAERMAPRLAGRFGYPADEPFQLTLHPDRLDLPYTWRKPRRVFVDSMSDLLHPDVPFEFVDRVFEVMARNQRHTFQVLTKRPERMAEWFATVCDRRPIPGRGVCTGCAPFCMGPDCDDHDAEVGWCGSPWPLPNAWIGTSVEDQAAADTRIPHLLQCPAAVRFLSCEPLLGAVSLARFIPPPRATYRCSYCGTFTTMGRGAAEITPCPGCGKRHGWCGSFHGDDGRSPINWVIAGGESGPRARPMHPDWARSLRDQCQEAGVPFFFKQWGEWVTEEQSPEDIVLPGQSTVPRGWSLKGPSVYRVGKHAAGAFLDGRLWREMPSPAIAEEVAHV